MKISNSFTVDIIYFDQLTLHVCIFVYIFLDTVFKRLIINLQKQQQQQVITKIIARINDVPSE